MSQEETASAAKTLFEAESVLSATDKYVTEGLMAGDSSLQWNPSLDGSYPSMIGLDSVASTASLLETVQPQGSVKSLLRAKEAAQQVVAVPPERTRRILQR